MRMERRRGRFGCVMGCGREVCGGEAAV